MIHRRLVYMADDRRIRWREDREDGIRDQWIRCPFEKVPGQYCFADCAAIALETVDGFDYLVCRGRQEKFKLGILDQVQSYDLHRSLTWGSDLEEADRHGRR
jgi:hypothetical protein